MILEPKKKIEDALDILGLPKFITKEDVKNQYYFLAKKHHPDKGGEEKVMEQINVAYHLLIQYIEEFRYTFDEEEISKQFPGANHVQRFR